MNVERIADSFSAPPLRSTSWGLEFQLMAKALCYDFFSYEEKQHI